MERRRFVTILFVPVFCASARLCPLLAHRGGSRRLDAARDISARAGRMVAVNPFVADVNSCRV